MQCPLSTKTVNGKRTHDIPVLRLHSRKLLSLPPSLPPSVLAWAASTLSCLQMRAEVVERHSAEEEGRSSGGGVSGLSTQAIVAAVRPLGRQRVPDAVKAQLLAEIKALIMSL
jgi:hypothetical protein